MIPTSSWPACWLPSPDCPRLCYLQFVQGEFLDSAELAEGRFQHRFVDAEQDAVPEDFVPFHARSVSLTAPQAGVCCRIDLLEGDGQAVRPVEYKRGEAARAPAGPYEPHLMQLAAQCLALRENGFSCQEAGIVVCRSIRRSKPYLEMEGNLREFHFTSELARYRQKRSDQPMFPFSG